MTPSLVGGYRPAFFFLISWELGKHGSFPRDAVFIVVGGSWRRNDMPTLLEISESSMRNREWIHGQDGMKRAVCRSKSNNDLDDRKDDSEQELRK
jgi:hypothetical protein